jgi:hypothetical protein
MNFETATARSREITIDGKTYQASVLTVTDLNDAAELLLKQARAINPEAVRLTMYETAWNLIFSNPQLAMYAALVKNDSSVTFAMVDGLNLVGNDEAIGLVAYLVGLELQKKTS